MNPTDHWTDLKAAGVVPPPSPEVVAHAQRQLEVAATGSRRRRIVRRRVLVPALAAASTAAVVVAAVAIYQDGSGPVAVPGPAVQSSQSVSSVMPTSPSKKPSHGVAGSCAFGYSPAELKKRAFAFDGTVVKVVEAPGGAFPTYLLTFEVHEWFRPVTGGRAVTVRTLTPPRGSDHYVSVEFPDYAVGTRLLITGEPQWGGTNPLKDAFAWGCGFSRPYDATAAATWRKILSK